MNKIIIFLFLLTPLINICAEDNLSGSGQLALELRSFRNDHNNTTKDQGAAVFSKVESEYKKGSMKSVIGGMARFDEKDHNRNYMTFEDAYLSYSFGSRDQWKTSLGFKIFNWTATETFHPADVINSRNLDSDIEQFEKKGELQFSLERQVYDGVISLYFFPRREDPEYPGVKSRLGAGITLERPVWVDGKNDLTSRSWGNGGGIRLTQNLGDGDLSLHVLRHMDRDMPLIGINLLGLIIQEYMPYYFRLWQYGGTYQHVLDRFIFKLEAAYRDFENEDLIVTTTRGQRKAVDHTQVAFGVEYGYAHQNGSESFLFLEGQSIWGTNKSRRAELSIFQRDMMLGYRYAFNDVYGKELFISTIFDLERSHEYFYNLRYSQRLTDVWKIKTGIRIYDAPPKDKTNVVGLETFHKDDHIYFNLIRYF